MAYRILIIDDSMPMRTVLKKVIFASGYGEAVFYEAADGREALSIMKKEWLDIVVTDFNMPGMNGLDMLKEMNADSEIDKVPVLVVTTERSQAKIKEFMDSGAAGYIKKPFTPEEIKEKLTEILGEVKYESESEDSNSGFDF